MNEQIQIPISCLKKKQIPEFALQLKDNLLEQHSALEAYVKAYSLREVLDELLKSLKDDALALVTSTEMDVYGAKVEQRRLKKTYDYGEDRQLQALVEHKEAAQEALNNWLKIRQLQKTELVDFKTGEVLPPPKILTDGVTLAVTLP